MKKIVIAAVIIGFSLNAQAQISNYLAPGKSGFGIQAVGEQGPKFQGLGGGIGASYKGKVDFNLMTTRDVLPKDANDLLTDQATGNYYEAKITLWLFRNQITPGINASFGVLAGLDGATYKDFTYLNQKTDNSTEYKSYIAGMAGFQAAVSFNLSENWILQPSFVAYYDFGKQFENAEGNDYSGTYAGVINNICISLIRRIGEGNAFVITVNNLSQSSGAGSFYNLTAGYIFAF
jgi:hypothetical protein